LSERVVEKRLLEKVVERVVRVVEKRLSKRLLKGLSGLSKKVVEEWAVVRLGEETHGRASEHIGLYLVRIGFNSDSLDNIENMTTRQHCFLS
jgi:hypothetical protein